MASKAPQERFAQFAYLSVTESAANTLTTKKLETGISVHDKIAWLISRIEYNTPDILLIGSADALEYGLSAVQDSAMMAALTTDQSVLDYNINALMVYGAAASANIINRPIIKDLSSLPGGGYLTSAHSLYAFSRGTSLASAATVYVKVWYQTVELQNEEFWDLVQMHQPLRA